MDRGVRSSSGVGLGREYRPVSILSEWELDLDIHAHLRYFCTLGGLLPDNEFGVWILAVRITELVFGPGRAGFTEEMIALLQRLILRHNVLTEEVLGIEKCVVTVHNLVHLTEDIDRFSAPDNYWCYCFERAVSKYVSRSSNKRNIERTYANAECRREFLKFTHFKNQQQPLPEIPEGRLVILDLTREVLVPEQVPFICGQKTRV